MVEVLTPIFGPFAKSIGLSVVATAWIIAIAAILLSSIIAMLVVKPMEKTYLEFVSGVRSKFFDLIVRAFAAAVSWVMPRLPSVRMRKTMEAESNQIQNDLAYLHQQVKSIASARNAEARTKKALLSSGAQETTTGAALKQILDADPIGNMRREQNDGFTERARLLAASCGTSYVRDEQMLTDMQISAVMDPITAGKKSHFVSSMRGEMAACKHVDDARAPHYPNANAGLGLAAMAGAVHPDKTTYSPEQSNRMRTTAKRVYDEITAPATPIERIAESSLFTRKP
jgi:hypothetical protein